MQSIPLETGCEYESRFHHHKMVRCLDSPAKAGSLAYHLHHPTLHSVPLRLRAVKGRRLYPLTVLGFTALCAQWDGSGGSRQATSFSNVVGYLQNTNVSFQTEDQLHFLQHQELEEVDGANHEFEIPS